MLGLHVVFAVDRAGLVGEDGETHHGIYDVGFLRHAPGLSILCPASRKELTDMLRWAVLDQNGPVAIRYPRGGNRDYEASEWENHALACHRTGSDVTVVTYGTLVQNAMDAAEILAQQGIRATVLRLLTVKPLPVEEILTHKAEGAHVIVVEEVSGNCGIRDTLAYELQHRSPECRVDGIDLGSQFVQHGAVDLLYDHYGLSAGKIAEFVQEVYHGEN